MNGTTLAPGDRVAAAAGSEGGSAGAAGGPQPSIGALWLALCAVPDPEIPVVSVVELGIVRGIEWDPAEPGRLKVVVTPTYSGCPATELIMSSIRDALAAAGVPRATLETRLFPAWTTGWMAPAARQKLRDFGIAPPEGPRAASAATVDVAGISPLRRSGVAVPCPRCGSLRTSLISQFGSTACKAQYRCVDCLEPFDYFKPH